MRKIVFSAAVILTVVNLAALGTWLYYRAVNGRKVRMSEVRSEQFEEVRHKLALSPGQVDDFNKYRSSFYARMDSLSAQLTKERTELINDIWQTPADTARIDALLNGISRAQSAAQRTIIAHLTEIRRILTPRQQEKLRAIVLRRFASASDGRGPAGR